MIAKNQICPKTAVSCIKHQLLTLFLGKPEVHHREISIQHDEFMVLASDGVWEVLSPQQVVDFIRTRLARKQSLQSVSNQDLNRSYR